MANLTSLLVKMGLETTALRQDMNRSRRDFKEYAKRSTQELGKISGGFSSIGKAARLAGSALATLGLGNVVSEQVRLSSETLKFSKTLGTTTENLSSLTFVAARSNVEFRTLSQLLQRQTRRIGEAAKGYGEAKNVLDEIGLSAQELSKLDSVDVFRLLSPILKNAATDAERLRIATKLFDTEGAQAALRLIDNLKDLEDQAEEVGAVINDEVAQALADLEDTITNLKATSSGFFRDVIAGWVIGAQKAKEYVSALVNGDKATVQLDRTTKAIEKQENKLASLTNVISKLNSQEGRNPAIQQKLDKRLSNRIIEYEKGVERLAQLRSKQVQLESIISNDLNNQPDEASAAGGSTPAALKKQSQRRAELKLVLLKFREANTELDAIVSASDEKAARAAKLQAEVSAAQSVIEALRFQSTDAQGQIALSLAADLNALREASKQVGLSQKELAQLERQLSAVAAADIAQLAERARKAAESSKEFAKELESITDQAARNMQDAFADFLFDPFEDGVKGMVKSFLDAIRRMVANAAAARIFQSFSGSASGSGSGSGILGAIVGSLAGAATGSATGAATTKAAIGAGVSGKSGGTTLVFNQTIDARNADASLASRLPAILEASNRALEATIYGKINRGIAPI